MQFVKKSEALILKDRALFEKYSCLRKMNYDKQIIGIIMFVWNDNKKIC